MSERPSNPLKWMAWARKVRLPRLLKPAYQAIAAYVDGDGACFPSNGTLAEDLDVSVRTVRRKVRALREAGFISSTERRKPDGLQTSNTYRLIWTSAEGQAEADVTKRQARSTTKPVIVEAAPVIEPELAFHGAQNRHLHELPPSWFPCNASIAVGIELGFPRSEILGEMLPKFRDNALARGLVRVDWNAAFNNWLRDEPRHRRHGRQRSSAPAPKPNVLFEDLIRNGDFGYGPGDPYRKHKPAGAPEPGKPRGDPMVEEFLSTRRFSLEAGGPVQHLAGLGPYSRPARRSG